MKFMRRVSFIDFTYGKLTAKKRRLIIQVISHNSLEDKIINGFHVTTRQRQINHFLDSFVFPLALFVHLDQA